MYFFFLYFIEVTGKVSDCSRSLVVYWKPLKAGPTITETATKHKLYK